jgi:hypothetical protein
MTCTHRAAARRGAALFAALAVFLTLGFAAAPGAHAAGLSIELNKIEDSDGACLGTFVIGNGMGHSLDRFSLDLYVFDRDGVVARRVAIDLAPLRRDKTTVTRFPLIQSACDRVGRVLVNDIPACRSADSGEMLDCLTDLSLTSRAGVELSQ